MRDLYVISSRPFICSDKPLVTMRKKNCKITSEIMNTVPNISLSLSAPVAPSIMALTAKAKATERTEKNALARTRQNNLPFCPFAYAESHFKAPLFFPLAFLIIVLILTQLK